MKKQKLRAVKPNIENLFEVSTNSFLTLGEITKRADILAKLFLKYNLTKEKKEEIIKKSERKEKPKEKEKKAIEFYPMDRLSVINEDEDFEDEKSLKNSVGGKNIKFFFHMIIFPF